MSLRRVEINDETGDIYVHGRNRPIGHIEDFLHERTALAKAVKSCWKEYLLKLDQFAASRDSSIGCSAQPWPTEHPHVTRPYDDH